MAQPPVEAELALCHVMFPTQHPDPTQYSACLAPLTSPRSTAKDGGLATAVQAQVMQEIHITGTMNAFAGNWAP